MVSVMTSLSMSMSPSRQPGPASQPGLASPVPGTVVVVLGTGGTIAGQAEDAARALRYASARHGVAWLLGAVPALARFALEAEQVAQVDSRNMEMAVLARLVGRVAHHLGRPEVAGVVITHGTDTLEETAWLLHRVLQPARPVVLTAAMRPANALGADGPLNLHDAVAVAAGAPEQPVRAGVWLAFDGRVWPGWAVRKVHSWRPQAFDGGGEPPAAELVDGRVRWFGPPSQGDRSAPPWGPHALAHPVPVPRDLPAEEGGWPWVEIVASHAGASGRAVDALVAAGVRGLVVAATGHGSWHASMRPALQRAADAGIALLRATRCAAGGIVGDDQDDLVPSAGHLTPAQARIELALRLMERRGVASR